MVSFAVIARAEATWSTKEKFTSTYPHTANSKLDSCRTCHTDAYDAKHLNRFASDYRGNNSNWAAIEGLDSDGDGVLNIDEINALTFPGDPGDLPEAQEEPAETTSPPDEESSTTTTTTSTTSTTTTTPPGSPLSPVLREWPVSEVPGVGEPPPPKGKEPPPSTTTSTTRRKSAPKTRPPAKASPPPRGREGAGSSLAAPAARSATSLSPPAGDAAAGPGGPGPPAEEGAEGIKLGPWPRRVAGPPPGPAGGEREEPFPVGALVLTVGGLFTTVVAYRRYRRATQPQGQR
jgi:hypothetical protein